ncbi:sugar transporter ERD6-like 5 isoform X2 [Silene latifolia]|uniref:sugar transporter ERD6-like 5 isoform X2 n=1 Tax=Silene latifolia TaxID=37657 RepID=UPI003D77C228
MCYGLFHACSVFINHGFTTFNSRVFLVWIIVDCWRTLRCTSLWENNRLHWSSCCKSYYFHFTLKKTMGLSSYLFLIGWLTIACSQGSWSLDFGRLALGFANGITVYAVPVYIAEITPKDLRGGSVLLHQVMLCSGIAVVFMSGIITSWQILALIGTLPCLIQLVGIYFIPESPRWLIRKQHSLELPVKSSCSLDYEAALQRLRGTNTDISEEAAAIKANTEAIGNNVKHKFSNVFQKKYAYALIVCLGLMALAGFGGTFGILFYATAIFDSAGFSGTIGSSAMGLIQLPPTVLGVFLMDKFGRRPLLLFSAAGMGTGTLSLALSFLLKEHDLMTDFSPYLALFGILLFAATYPVGMGGVPFVIMSEIFPINIKGAAGSLATVVSFTSSWIVSYAFNFMMVWSSYGTFLVFTGVNVISLLFVAKLVPETKGRTLEEIQTLVTYK